MRFTLHYSGPLRASGRPEHKHELRRAFHVQLAELWRHEPLSKMMNLHLPKGDPARKLGESVSSFRPLGPFNFIPLATNELRLIAGLEVVLLRPEPPGRLVTQGGDIDNRLKTLFDALSMPQLGGLPQGAHPADDESPFFCVLEDDNLITAVNVQTEHLLAHREDPCHVELVLRVVLTPTSAIWANMAF